VPRVPGLLDLPQAVLAEEEESGNVLGGESV